jgi:hypothetical protein
MLKTSISGSNYTGALSADGGKTWQDVDKGTVTLEGKKFTFKSSTGIEAQGTLSDDGKSFVSEGATFTRK